MLQSPPAEAMPPRLIADAMLGKLARWLRLLGYDTRYLQEDDAYIAQQARAEGRVLLTRDHALAARRGIRTLLIASAQLDAQLAQVVRALGAPPPATAPRCMACNVALITIPPEIAARRVPPYVAQTQAAFRECPQCHKVYWPGSHWEGIQARLAAVLSAE